MIDATFYDDSSVPTEWKGLFPDWLVAVGYKVQKDLLDEIRGSKNKGDAIARARDYLVRRGLVLIEPIQVTLLSKGSVLYHDWFHAGRETPVLSAPPYGFMKDLMTNEARVVFWADTAANERRYVKGMRRQNLGLVSRIPDMDVLLIVELHWGPSLTPFEHQVAHLKPLVLPVQIEIVDASELLMQKLLKDPDELYRIGAERFEDLLQNRLDAMGFKTQRVGKTFTKDGGVDLLFWREDAPFPFLGALQAKYHSSPEKKSGSGHVRDFAGTIRAIRESAFGVLVTNTTFTYDAEWVASKLGSQIRLRDQQDLRRWISGRFVDALEWREIPAEIELCPGVRVHIPKRNLAKL